MQEVAARQRQCAAREQASKHLNALDCRASQPRFHSCRAAQSEAAPCSSRGASPAVQWRCSAAALSAPLQAAQGSTFTCPAILQCTTSSAGSLCQHSGSQLPNL